MMPFSKILGFTLLMTISINAHAYVVKKGDTLASIVIANYTIPAYGPNGGVEKLVKLNSDQLEKGSLKVGMVLKLNKEYLKPGIVDDSPETSEDRIGKVVAELPSKNQVKEATADSKAVATEETEANPYIQIEKYDQVEATKMQKSNLDDIQLYASYKFNSIRTKNLVSFQEYTVNTSTETEVGFEYSRGFAEKWAISALAAFNHYSTPLVTTTTPNLKKSENSQALGQLGISYRPSERTHFKLSLLHRPYFYAVLDQNNDIEIEYKPSVAYGFAAKNYFYQAKDINLGLGLGLNYVNNAKVAGNGVGFSGGLIFEQVYKGGDKAMLEVSYQQISLDSSQLSSLNNAVLLKFDYVPDF